MPTIFTNLERGTIEALTHAYNRMTTANEQNSFLSDLNHGPTAILVATTAAGSLDDEHVIEGYKKFQDHREVVRQGVIERLNDSKPYLDAAIDAIQAELQMTVECPASQRHYEPATPVGFIGDDRTLPAGP